MDHAEVLARLEAAVVGPGRLWSIETDDSADGLALREHIASCAECAAEWRAWQTLHAGLAAAAPDDLHAPAEARSRVLAAVVANGVPRGVTTPAEPAGIASAAPWQAPSPAPSAVPPPPAPAAPQAWAPPAPAGSRPTTAPGQVASPSAGQGGLAARARARRGATGTGAEATGIRFRWLALAAAAVALVFVTGALLGPMLGLTSPGSDTSGTGLTRVVTMTADILSRGGALTASLQTADGSPGGAVVVSPGSGALVVVSTALSPLEGGARYLCYLERDGVRISIGEMHFDGDVAYWAGPVTDPPDPGRQGDGFIVLPEGSSGPPVLSGTF